MAFKFEKLEIWQKAIELSTRILQLVDTFPRRHQYTLGDQITRAADSICHNIAEGSTGQTNPEQILFLKYLYRSAIETVSCVFLGKKWELIPEDEFNYLYNEYEILVKRIRSFQKNLR